MSVSLCRLERFAYCRKLVINNATVGKIVVVVVVAAPPKRPVVKGYDGMLDAWLWRT